MKLVSVGIDPYHVGFTADHVSAELFDLQWPGYSGVINSF